MTQQRLIVSTCGTSALTNIAGEERTLVTKYANARTAEDIPETVRKRLQSVIDAMQRRLTAAKPDELSNLSAELNGLLWLNMGQLDASRDNHWLIATDTWLGKSTADAISKVLERYDQIVEVKPISDLRTDSLDEFHIAMTDLASLCAEEVRGWREGGWKIIFNLTGGFKSVQGFMQTLGMLYADETVYVFERTNELLCIPRLPIRMDIEDVLRGNEEALRAFQRMAIELPVTEDETRGLPGTLLIKIDGEVALSVWGKIVWDNSKYKLLGKSLLPPITTNLRYAPGFEKTVKQYQQETDRMYKINERLMDLARHLEDKQYNPKRLDFKQLKGKHDPWTHECDAWADKDARRIFGHFEGDTFVVDDLQKGLH